MFVDGSFIYVHISLLYTHNIWSSKYMDSYYFIYATLEEVILDF